MRRTRLLPLLAALVGLAAAACAGEPTAAPPATESPLTLTGDIAAGGAMTSPDGRLVVLTQSETPVSIRLTEVRSGPALPAGWHPLTPMYDLAVHDQGSTAATLAMPLTLRLSVPAGGLSGGLLHDGTAWRQLTGDRDALSTLTVTTDRGGIVTAAQPLNPNLTPTPVPVITIAPRATPGDGGPVIATTPSPSPTPSPTRTGGGPSLTLQASFARSALDPLFDRFFSRRTNTLGLLPLDGPPLLDVPPSLLGVLTARGQTVFAAPYAGVNEVFVTAMTDRGGASVALVVEPVLLWPADAAAAEATLRATFHGMTAPFAPRPSASGGFAFAASQDGTSYLFGVVRQSGLALAYALVGGGGFAGDVAAAAAP